MGLIYRCGVTTSTDEYFPLAKTLPFLRQEYDATSVMIPFWSQISEETYYEFIEDAKKA